MLTPLRRFSYGTNMAFVEGAKGPSFHNEFSDHFECAHITLRVCVLLTLIALVHLKYPAFRTKVGHLATHCRILKMLLICFKLLSFLDLRIPFASALLGDPSHRRRRAQHRSSQRSDAKRGVRPGRVRTPLPQ